MTDYIIHAALTSQNGRKARTDARLFQIQSRPLCHLAIVDACARRLLGWKRQIQSHRLRKRVGLAMKPEITLIKKCGSNSVMSKRIFLDGQGKVCSDGSQCLMAHGTATRATAETAADLAKHIMACGTDEAIALGTLRDDLPHPVKVATAAKLRDNQGAITRSRDFIDYRPGAPAWALIDFDTKGMPSNVAAGIEAAGGWNALLRVAPGLERAARVSRASTSSGLYRSDTGNLPFAAAAACTTTSW